MQTTTAESDTASQPATTTKTQKYEVPAELFGYDVLADRSRIRFDLRIAFGSAR